MCCECGIVAFANTIIGVCVGSIVLDLAEMFVGSMAAAKLVQLLLLLSFLLGVPLFVYRLRGRLGEAGIAKKLLICWAVLAVPTVLATLFEMLIDIPEGGDPSHVETRELRMAGNLLRIFRLLYPLVYRARPVSPSSRPPAQAQTAELRCAQWRSPTLRTRRRPRRCPRQAATRIC